MKKKTKNRHGGYGLQVLLLMLVMLVGGITNIQAQAYITDVIVLGNYDSALDAKNLRNEYTNKGWTVLEERVHQQGVDRPRARPQRWYRWLVGLYSLQDQ